MSVYRAVLPVILASLVFQLGNGLMTTLLSLRLDIAGFSTQIAGLVSAAYYAGLLLGTRVSQDLIFRVGHIRAFAAFAAIAGTTMLLHAMFVDPLVWCILRAIAGYSLAALFIVMESWLNMAARNENRGRVFSLYMVANYAAIGLGQLFLIVYGARGFEAFSLATILVLLAIVPVCLTRQAVPAQGTVSRLTLRQLFVASPLGIVASFGSGALLAPLYALVPIYGRQAGLNVTEISIWMAAIIFGGFILAWPLGRLSDRMDRRRILLAVCLGLSGAATFLAASSGDDLRLLLAAGAVYGGMAFAVYPIGVAHTNDFLPAEDAVAATGGLLLAFGLGAVMGPIGAAALMDAVGRNALFYYSSAGAVALAAFTLWRMRVRGPAPDLDKTIFVPMTTTTPAPLQLDPWTEAASEAVAEPSAQGQQP
ncbi:MAG: MFS transporter [Alphaproteobacteria bacterium]